MPGEPENEKRKDPQGTELGSLQSSLVIFTPSFESQPNEESGQGKLGAPFQMKDLRPREERTCAE